MYSERRKPSAAVQLLCGRDLGHVQVEMLDPLQQRSAMQVVACTSRSAGLHGMEELDREAERILNAKRRALAELDLVADPVRRAAERREMLLDQVEIVGDQTR